MADSKGIYFGGGNRGLATILDSGETERTRARLSMDEQRKVAQQVADKERRDKQAEQLKNFDAWRVYQPALQKKYDDIANRLKKGELDPFTLRQELNSYAGQAQASMQLQDEWKQASADYEKNKKVLGNAADWYIQRYHGDPSVDNLTKISSSPLNRYGFVDEKGGSQYINPTESFNDVITKSLGNWVESEVQNAVGKGQVVARGLMQFKSQHDTSKLKSFSEVDPKTGKIQVKDVDALIESGVLDLFESDPYTNRVLEDETDRIIGKSEVSPEDRERLKTQILRNYLQPYGSSGKVTTETKATQQSFSVRDPASGGGSGSGSGGSDGKTLANRFIGLYDETGYVPGEKQKYTVDQLKERGYSDSDARKMVKEGTTYVNSDAFLGQKSDGGSRLGYVQDTRVNNKVAPKKGGKILPYIEVYEPKEGGGFNKTHKPLTIDLMRNYVPQGSFKDFEKELRSKGRIDENGIFIMGDNRNAESKMSKHE